MNYFTIYNQIIERAKHRTLTGYIERHHIIPRCIGGLDTSDNIVKLTAREHYICHRILVRLYPHNSKLVYAFWAMSNQKSKYQQRSMVSSRAYSEAKEMFSSVHSEREVSTETRKKLSNSRKGKSSPKSQESIQKLINSGVNTRFTKGQDSCNKGKKLSAETLKKRSESRKDYKISEETKQKISNTLKGKSKPTRDVLWKQKQSKAKKGIPRADRHICETCNKSIGGLGNYKKHIKCCKTKIK